MGVDYRRYAEQFARHRQIADVRTFATVHEGADDYPLLHAHVDGHRYLTITAGFHGDEVAGPLTLLEHLDDVVAYARARHVGLEIFPCLNPSGFTDGTRYNRSGEKPNNDFLRYEVFPGSWIDVLPKDQKFLRHELFRGGPKETRALRAELEQLPAPAAALDIHQDPWIGGAQSYVYAFGDRAAYLPLLASAERSLPLMREAEVDVGVYTDADGLIEHHDGSVTDYMFRRGVPFTAAIETTTAAARDACDGVNLAWIRGFIDLAAA